MSRTSIGKIKYKNIYTLQNVDIKFEGVDLMERKEIEHVFEELNLCNESDRFKYQYGPSPINQQPYTIRLDNVSKKLGGE